MMNEEINNTFLTLCKYIIYFYFQFTILYNLFGIFFFCKIL